MFLLWLFSLPHSWFALFGQLETALPHFFHPIISHALGYVLAYLRSLDWVLTRRPCSYLYGHCTTKHLDALSRDA